MIDNDFILFLSEGQHSLHLMAEGLAGRMAPDCARVLGASIAPVSRHPGAVQVMQEVGVDLTALPLRTPLDVEVTSFDIVVTLGDIDPSFTLTLPGMPPRFHWPVTLPGKGADDAAIMDSLRAARDELETRIDDLFTSDLLHGLAVVRRNLGLVLDNLAFGVMAHTVNRRIFFFNQAAERITGYSRGEVLGKDCHRVFRRRRFCGGDCSFCEGSQAPRVLPLEKTREVVFDTPGGEARVFEMTVRPLVMGATPAAGAVVSFQDHTELHALRGRVRHHHRCGDLIGMDPSMQALFEQIREVGPTALPVLIEGESGVGKELVARAIHQESPRAKGPFVAINCGALPEGILESELFGHVRGAFTGAVRDQRGRFELAHGGTLLLDEIGELPLPMQVKLLRVLQERQFERVGGEKTLAVDVRILSATNLDLRQLMAEGRFRRDLYYRLCVVPIAVPPLRDRRMDVAVLVDHFLEGVARQSERAPLRVSNEALDVLTRYLWPGNIRELRNVIEYAYLKCRHGVILPSHLPAEVSVNEGQPRRTRGPSPKLDETQVARALEAARGDRSQASRLLGVGRSTLYRFLRRHGIG